MSLLTHVPSRLITVQTPGLVPIDNSIQKLVSLSFILPHMFQADIRASCFFSSSKLFGTCSAEPSDAPELA